MLDINFIRANLEQVKASTKEKGYSIDIAEAISLDDTKKSLSQEVESLRAERNSIAAQMKNGKPEPALIEKGKSIKQQLAEKEPKLEEIEQKLSQLLQKIPNVIDESVPLGGEEDSVTIKEWGDKKSEGIDHLDFATEKDWVDFDRGAKTSGSKFYFLKGGLAELEQAIVRYAMDKVIEKGFTLMSVPHLVNSRTLEGTGFAPRSTDQSDEYFLEGEDLALIATAEISLTGYHADEIIDEKDLPLLYAGYSPCYRKEAGSAGKYTRGLFRVHQFNKLEMYVFCVPEQSKAMHEQILRIEEEIYQELNIPYRIINIAAGDLGAPAAKKYDVEYWSPVSQQYREITSCSNCTDFQARNLNIRVRRETGKIEVLHTLNGTAVSLARCLVAVIENYAMAGGTLNIPLVLQPYLKNKETL